MSPMPSRRAFARLLLLPAAALAITACDDDDYGNDPGAPLPQATDTLLASGSIDADVVDFRTVLGAPNNGSTAGQQPAGRREISWDGPGANPFNNKNDFPADFFNVQFKGGAVFTTPGTGFRNDSTRFVEVDTSYAGQFRTFSPTKVFAPVGSHVMDVHFRVAGDTVRAAVTGFGVVFSDVDVAGATTVELFDRDGRRLIRLAAPVRSDSTGLSFAGARFAEPIVARARITSGTGPLAAGQRDVSAGGSRDLVVLDNFLYGEPTALPPR